MPPVALTSRAAVSLTARSAFLALAAITMSACHTEVTAPDLFGTWGGDHIRLEVSGTGATLEYDCAVGTIEGSILPRDGRFSASGTHTFSWQYVKGYSGPSTLDAVFIDRVIAEAGLDDVRIASVFVEQGRLDEVFRDITTKQAAKQPAHA